MNFKAQIEWGTARSHTDSKRKEDNDSMLKKRVTAFLLAITISISFFALPAQALTFTPDFEISSEGAYLVNLDTDTVIYAKNEHKQFCPASLTKIMTAIIALENCSDLSTKVTAPVFVFDDLYGRNASNCGMSAGEEMTMLDLLYGLMLKSGCDAAGTIAYYFCEEDTDAFVKMMNDKAKQIGANDTVFADPHGLNDGDSFTTAYDMYLITKYALSLPKFEEIATTYYYELPPTNKRGENDSTRYWTHTNAMMNDKSVYYNQYVKGIKTGTASSSGIQNLVTMAQKDGNTYLLSVLGAPTRDSEGNRLNGTTKDSGKLYNWVFNDFSMRSIVDLEEYIAEVPVELSSGNNYVMALPGEDVLSFLPNDLDLNEALEKVPHLNDEVLAPIKKGDKVGTMELKIDGETLATVNLIAANDVERSTLKYILYEAQRFFENKWVKVGLVVLAVLVFLYIVFSISYNYKKRKRRKSRNRLK
jgi:D-alanyl-D-alanine carboxypeptidase (penicillin-binding protein 5/6)